MKEKLHVYVLRWMVGKWVLTTNGALVRAYANDSTKLDAIWLASVVMQEFWVRCGQCSELRILNKNGRFSPARTFPRKRDPRKSRG